MKKSVLGLLLLCLASLASAQNTVTVTSSHFTDSLGNPLSGYVYFQPVNCIGGYPLAYRLGGGGTVQPNPVQVTVTAGALSLTLPNTVLTYPANVCFAMSYPAGTLPIGYSTLQPHYTAYNSADWCQAGVCNLDNYLPGNQPLPTLNAVQAINFTAGELTFTGSGVVQTGNTFTFTGGFTAGGDLSGSSTSQEVVGLLGNALPSLATGYLNWTGSAWALSPGGGIGGTVDAGYVPIATAPNTLGDGPINQDETQDYTLYIGGTEAGGILIDTTTDDYAPVDGPISIIAGTNLHLETYPTTDPNANISIHNEGNGTGALLISNSQTGGTTIADSGGGGLELDALNGPSTISIYNGGSGGIQITDSGGGGITISNGGGGGTQITDGGGGITLNAGGGATLSPGNVVIGGLLIPGTIYSAAGTPIPVCTSAQGFAVVADSTTQVWGTTYVSGGMLPAALFCDGTNWTIYAK